MPEPKRQAKYMGIVNALRADIESAKYGPGARIPSEAELTRRFNVSRMTVVKAVQQLQQEGLLNRKVGSGTYANSAPETEGRSFGLLIPDLGETEIFEPICRGMMRMPSIKANSLSWGQASSSTEGKEKETEELCHSYIKRGVDGVFFAPLEFPAHHDVNSRILSALEKARIPVVLLDKDFVEYPHRSQYDLVSLNNRYAGFVVTEHLIRQGAKRVGFFCRDRSAQTVEHRIVGYREALYMNGLSISRDLVIRGDASDREFVAKAMRQLNVDAIMCANDLTAARLMQTLLSLGMRIPEKIRIAGVDDVRYASLLPIPLTTLHQPCADIGIASMSAMLERIVHPHLPARSILLDGKLVVRKSCGGKVPSAPPPQPA